MATRSILSKFPASMERSSVRVTAGAGVRFFSDKVGGKILSEEERAAENVYIKKKEKEMIEKAKKLKAEKEKAEAEKKKSSD